MILKELVLTALLQFAPPEKQDINPWKDDSREASLVRYDGIADAIVAVCGAQPKEGPPPDATNAEIRCASMLSAIAIGESGLARDADQGPCYAKGDHKSRCDGGLAASVWQVHSYTVWDKEGKNPKKVTVKELFADRTLAAKRAHFAAMSSISRCKDLPREDILSALSGKCQVGLKSARARYKLWNSMQGWMNLKNAPPAAKN